VTTADSALTPSTTTSSTTIDRKKLAADLRRDEGERLKLYKDTAGKWTIGVGRNLSDRGISKAESEYLLQNDITDHLQELYQALPWLAKKPEPIQRALANMAFNLGVPGLLKFTTTLAYVQAGQYNAAANALLANRKYAKQIGERIERLASLLRSVV
jgi:lysozyme